MLLKKFKLIKQGAEARIYKGVYLGKEVVAKERFEKGYRNPDLDKALTKERMKAECRAIVKCKAVGIETPCLYLVDFERQFIIMEYIINNVTAKQYIEDSSKQEREIMSFEIGKIIGKMHKANIIHGDLTTSNILIKQDVKGDAEHSGNITLVFIDFGLSHCDSSVEDKGVDLYVLERALESTHSTAEEIFSVLLEGYEAGNPSQSKNVLKRFKEVRARGRKRNMVG